MAAITVIPVESWDANSILIPDDGDPGDSNAWLQGAQPIANSLAWLKDHIVGLSDTTRVRRVPMSPAYQSSNHWSFLPGATTQSLWAQTTISTADLSFPITHLLPPFGRIREVYLGFEGGTGHAALPAVMPSFRLVKWVSDDGQPSYNTTPMVTIATTSDGSSSVADYEKVHYVIMNGLTEDINANSDEYAILVRGESGAQSIANQLRIGYVAFVVSE